MNIFMENYGTGIFQSKYIIFDFANFIFISKTYQPFLAYLYVIFQH
jgi:hypothetical protein